MIKKSKGWKIIEHAITDELISCSFPTIQAETMAINITRNIAEKSRGEALRISENKELAKRNSDIFKLYQDGIEIQSLCDMFKLTQNTVYTIIKREKNGN